MTWLALWQLIKRVPWRVWALLAFLAAIVVAQLYLRHKWINEGRAQVIAERLAEDLAESEAKRAQEQADRLKSEQLAQDFVDLASGFLKDKQNAKAQADAVVADLRSGNLKLRQQWQGCVSAPGQTATGASGTDAAFDSRADSAGRIIGAAAQCDAQVSALQSILRLERQ